MTQIEKLDRILLALAYHKRECTDLNPTGYTMMNLCEIIKIEVSEGEAKILEDKLYRAEYIEYLNEKVKMVFCISSKGYDFIESGGYENLEKKSDIEKKKEEIEYELTKQ